MRRALLSVLAGAGMALLLFWLLALLVSPPEPDIEVQEMRLTMTELAPATEPEAAEPVSEPPAVMPPAATPPPLPEPAPLPNTALALPEPELPAEEPAPVELDSSLPELAEVPPDPPPESPPPEPRQEPRVEPAPTPAPAPAPSSTPSSAATSPAETVAKPVSREPVDVGQIAPTRRVPPEYPSRAQRRGLEGYVELAFVIRPDGSVDPGSIKVLSARPSNVFDKAARRSVSRWRFEPAQGLRRARQRLEFKLR